MKTLEQLIEEYTEKIIYEKNKVNDYGRVFVQELIREIALATIKATRIDNITDYTWDKKYEPKGMGYEDVQQAKIKHFLGEE